ncbi:hypothetical protein K458DRAFT_484006 [Lentithecium fluviatile CBS 122367]|uniref:Uncharacterized protein n=1 Tax=Lentithecium fluviatile CBS 122367 TaxID=1168545 RepID=A0A6G1JFK4_9PLEO|nr:hypothetical protein K458DRAFT_484006 [Lentithecium fluviatile CBS 122367]
MDRELEQNSSIEPDQLPVVADGQNADLSPATNLNKAGTGRNEKIDAKWISTQAQTIEVLAKDPGHHSILFVQKLMRFTGTSSTSVTRLHNLSNTCNDVAQDVLFLATENQQIFSRRCKKLRDSLGKLKRNIAWNFHMQDDARKFRQDSLGTLSVLNFLLSLFSDNRLELKCHVTKLHEAVENLKEDTTSSVLELDQSLKAHSKGTGEQVTFVPLLCQKIGNEANDERPVTSENVEAIINNSLQVGAAYASKNDVNCVPSSDEPEDNLETDATQNSFGPLELNLDRQLEIAESVSDHLGQLIDEELDTEQRYTVSEANCCLSCVAQSRLCYLDLAIYPDHETICDELLRPTDPLEEDSIWNFVDDCSERWGPEVVIEESLDSRTMSSSVSSRVSAEDEENYNGTESPEQPTNRSDNQGDHTEHTQDEQWYNEEAQRQQRMKKLGGVFFASFHDGNPPCCGGHHAGSPVLLDFSNPTRSLVILNVTKAV